MIKMSNAILRAKFVVNSVKRVAQNDGSIMQEEIFLNAVYADTGVNKLWSKWTPNGSLTMTISNSEAMGKVLPGQFYFIDFIPTDLNGI